MIGHFVSKLRKITVVILIVVCAATSSFAADVFPNGTFDSNINGWLNNTVISNGSTSWDGTVGGVSAGSIRYLSTTGRRRQYEAYDSILIPTAISSSASPIYLSFYWYKNATGAATGTHIATLSIVHPDGTTEQELWTESSKPNAGQILDGNVVDIEVSSSFQQTGNYYLKIYGNIRNGNNSSATGRTNFDDITLDVPVVTNNAPTISTGATAVSLSPVNRIGTNTTVISSQFADSDAPGVGAFTGTFKIREPNNSTELTLVNNQPNGSGGLTITDQGGGNYTASYTYDPGAGQTVGLYDLYFEVSDGTDNAIDDFTSNLDELDIIQQNVPTVTPRATTVSSAQVNRFGVDATTFSSTFTDLDQPGSNAFTISFKTREPNNVTEVILVNGQTNGNGGLTVTDNGGGSYTATYSWDPGGTQTLGLYDLYFEVSDGSDNAIDDFTNNLDELETIQQQAPAVSPGAATVSVSPLNRVGVNTTVLSATYTDLDQPGVGAFTVSFKVREPNDVTEVTLVNAQTNGNGGLTIIDNGGGSYTASYSWDPGDAQTLGDYDLYFEVSDGIDNTIDGYTSNLNELNIIQQTAPSVAAGATAVGKSPVGWQDNELTVFQTTFTDADQPALSSFIITFKVREPDNSTEVLLVDAQTNGNGGLTVIDNGGGSYTASFTWNPPNGTSEGLYDLYFQVSDGIDIATDDYTGNLDELEVVTTTSNAAPTLTGGATSVSVASINRLGANSTLISTDFNDTDLPVISSFVVTIKVREPDNSTEVILVNALTNGSGGLTVVDNGGGSYTASYSWDAGDAQTIGLYDLYFEVSDGVDNVIDDYTANLEELDIFQQTAPTVVAGATQSSKATVNRIGTDQTTISTLFTDLDQPGVGAFTVTFTIREPNNTTELISVNNLANGVGGLTITDQGFGNYEASYSYDPSAAQTVGLYDIYFEVSDGTDNAVDNFTSNLDEFDIVDLPPNAAPTVVASATSVSVSPANRYSTNTTVISTDFTDADVPGVSAFNVTFTIREPNNTIELILVNNEPNGGGGLTITDNGGGSYTASYTYDPDDAQVLGLYDLYFEVSDGTDNAIDGFTSNLDELEINEVIPPTLPSIVAGATSVSISPVNRVESITTVISCDFTDINSPLVSSFTINFKVREPDNTTQLILVNNLSHGAGGLTVIDNGSGSYTASYTYNPDDAQTLGLYDLFFDVNDGTGTATDDFTNNLDELQINEIITNNAPVIAAGAANVTLSPVNRFGVETTEFLATFTDADIPGINAFNMTLKLRHPDNSTITTLADDLIHGVGGITITDGGGGSYTMHYTWNPPDVQEIGLYDLYVHVRDGLESATDDYVNNLDELEIVEVLPNNAPTVDAGITNVASSTVNRIEDSVATVAASFYDADIPGVNAFTVTLKVREPNNITEIVLVNGLTNGNGGLVVTELGAGSGVYKAKYDWNPPDAQTLGLYDLYFEVSDGTDNATDLFTNNLDELEVVEFNTNDAPTLTAGVTGVTPSSIDRTGAVSTSVSATFTDVDIPGIGVFFVTFKLRAPNSAATYIAADSLQNGQSGMSIVDNGSGSYTASIDFDPLDNAILGYYDLYCQITDGTLGVVDDYTANLDELFLTNGGENVRPVVPTDAVFATPAGIERIGANLTTISATFTDGDAPAVTQFKVTIKVREPDNSTETILADNASHGAGVTITDLGGGVYSASATWDPPDAQTLGFHDLYFHVTDQIDTSYDGYTNNLDEIEIYDNISNNAPTVVGNATFVLPVSVNVNGTDFTMLKTSFSDVDVPGSGGFTVTFKVRDQSSTEYTIVNAARDSEQGLKIRSVGAGNYEASVLWDPPDVQTTGTYDLYFFVQDDALASATDDFVNNADELTVVATALLGDGNLLHRGNDADNCGGPNSACHDIVDHQTQNCRVCHTPHGSANIYLVDETIQTPNSGPKTVLFKTLGTGDPFNAPDPTEGDDNAGSMADDANAVQTEICETCHTTTKYYRNDDSHTQRAHHNVENCVETCHPHDGGFAPAGGAESSGGSACACHSGIVTPLTTSTTSYHHMLLSSDPDYTLSSKTCLQCHVDHDIFRPDLNVGFGQRAKNLRADITTPVVQGSNAVLSNTDYSSSGTGGLCLSCHTSAQTKSFTPPDGSSQTVAISKAGFDAATSSHNYSVPSTTFGDGSSFNANCAKCHNDTMTKSYGEFSTHDNPYGRILNPFGTASPADPLEENVCYACHSTTNNPNAGSNQDYYGVKTMSSTALGIESAFGKTFTHPTETFSGRHSSDETGSGLADGNRHAECVDCHDVHAVQQGTHDGSSMLVSNALKGAWGVEPTAWPAAPTPSDNANVFAAPVSYTKVEPATKEYQICLKCHSNYTTLPGGSRNLAEEINPNYPSTHGITIANQNPFCNSTTMFEPWGSSGIAWCSDCHRSDTPTDPGGPHGSNTEHMLAATIVSNETVGTPLCDKCHDPATYWSGSASASKFSEHPATKGAHQMTWGCFACHMWDYSSTAGLGVSTTMWEEVNNSTPPADLLVHGQNKIWNYNELDGSNGTGLLVDAFCNGFLADVDYNNNSCWADVCKGHDNKGY